MQINLIRVATAGTTAAGRRKGSATQKPNGASGERERGERKRGFARRPGNAFGHGRGGDGMKRCRAGRRRRGKAKELVVPPSR
ncbi:hypothetical protein NL676_036606 [Syzygium grande]|nr:hypothetical protein NL676_036606 [Syzygium grande]